MVWCPAPAVTQTQSLRRMEETVEGLRLRAACLRPKPPLSPCHLVQGPLPLSAPSQRREGGGLGQLRGCWQATGLGLIPHGCASCSSPSKPHPFIFLHILHFFLHISHFFLTHSPTFLQDLCASVFSIPSITHQVGHSKLPRGRYWEVGRYGGREVGRYCTDTARPTPGDSYHRRPLPPRSCHPPESRQGFRPTEVVVYFFPL